MHPSSYEIVSRHKQLKFIIYIIPIVTKNLILEKVVNIDPKLTVKEFLCDGTH